MVILLSGMGAKSVFLQKIQFKGFIQLVGHISAVLFSLFDAFGQQVFDLSVDTAEIILGPCGKGVVELRGQAKGNLLLDALVKCVVVVFLRPYP